MPPSTSRPLRLFSLEGAMAAFALYSLISGVIRGEILSVFWGGIIVCGLIVLHFVRRKDWQSHWADQSGQGARSDASSTLPPKDEP